MSATFRFRVNAISLQVIVTIQTSRLVLRPIVERDWSFLFELSNLPGVKNYLLPDHYTEAHAKRLALASASHAHLHSGLFFTFIIVHRETGEQIGACSLGVINARRRIAAIGFDVQPDHAGNGYATEAAEVLVGLGFGPCRSRRLRSECYSDNAASRRVMEKVGLVEKTMPWTRLALWWSYTDTRAKVRYEIGKRAWLKWKWAQGESVEAGPDTSN